MRLCLTFILAVYTNAQEELMPHVGPLKKDEILASPYEQPTVGPFNLPVPFGYVFRDGIDDPATGHKTPIDYLGIIQYLRERPKRIKKKGDILEHSVFKVPYNINGPKRYLSPRDEYLALLNHTEVNNQKDGERYIDFEKINTRNIRTQRPMTSGIRRNVAKKTIERMEPIESKFDDTSFMVRPKNNTRNNTSCKEFAKIGEKNVPYPKDIVDLDWEPFYAWFPSNLYVSLIHRFSYPTKKAVSHYKTTYNAYLHRKIDWNQPKLLLNTDTEVLLIAGDKIGLFYGIQNISLTKSVKSNRTKLPVLAMRMKIVDPYLAIMYCDNRNALLMATPENVPKTDQDKEEESKLLKFRGLGYPISRHVDHDVTFRSSHRQMMGQVQEDM